MTYSVLKVPLNPNQPTNQPMCCCAIGCQHSTLNRLFGSWFGCVFLVWRHNLRIIGAHFHTFFSTISLFLTFLNIHIYFIILKTYDQQFTLTTKKSLHIIFKYKRALNISRGHGLHTDQVRQVCTVCASLVCIMARYEARSISILASLFRSPN